MKPNSLEEWEARLVELMEEMSSEEITKAHGGNAAAKAAVEAWALEIQAASEFLLAQQAVLGGTLDEVLETINVLIDTVQAILLAMGIILLLRRYRKRRGTDGFEEVVVTRRTFESELGDRTKARPSGRDQDRVKDAAFLALRVQWTNHYLLTLFQGAILTEGLDLQDEEELIWVSRKDASVCPICRYMDGKRSINGNFLPVIMKRFPNFSAFGKVMSRPHAHPRCRCLARRESQSVAEPYEYEQESE